MFPRKSDTLFRKETIMSIFALLCRKIEYLRIVQTVTFWFLIAGTYDLYLSFIIPVFFLKKNPTIVSYIYSRKNFLILILIFWSPITYLCKAKYSYYFAQKNVLTCHFNLKFQIPVILYLYNVEFRCSYIRTWIWYSTMQSILTFSSLLRNRDILTDYNSWPDCLHNVCIFLYRYL